MDFKEWLREHEREVFKRNQGCFDKAYIFGAKNGFKAGQQSKQAEIDALKAELAKYQQEGYKLVPVEPTKAMQQSAFDVYEVCDYKNYHLNSGTEVRDMIYKAMIGAAE